MDLRHERVKARYLSINYFCLCELKPSSVPRKCFLDNLTSLVRCLEMFFGKKSDGSLVGSLSIRQVIACKLLTYLPKQVFLLLIFSKYLPAG